MSKHKFTNALHKETSPYLLQHAHNPVNWKAWSPETLKEVKESNKLMLISIGYAACHWCHVMEEESFEDTLVASIMNKNFVNIKIDREERPDIDQVYMSAVQLMTGSGGWPMNVVALPDGRPVWGGTYFPKGNWISALEQIQDIYKKNPEKLEDYANRLAEGMEQTSLVTPNLNAIVFKDEILTEAVKNWSQNFDRQKGGLNFSPKFMMPNNYHFLMRYAHQTKDEDLKKYVLHTLNQISYGGVYDHVGGGFSRYSTDKKWHVPHFEKMLYDNAQLISLYSDAYLLTKDPWYKQVVYETLAFIERELTDTSGAFYSSLDADSINANKELEEGAYYVWQVSELKEILGNDFKLFSEYYNVNSYGLWEHSNYVLIRKQNDLEFINKHKLKEDNFLEKQKQWKSLLLQQREQRPRPRLDDKTLTSWNALMLKGYVDAYRVFKEETFLEAAIKNAQFIKKYQLDSSGKLRHNYKNGKSTINGYLEDYAATIEAFVVLYEVSLDNDYLTMAEKMVNYVQKHFYDKVSKMYFFTSNLDTSLVTRNIESSDNVIPASNSIMAKNLYKLSHYLSNRMYLEQSKQMLHNVQLNFEKYSSGYSNWMDLYLNFTDSFYEVVVTGVNSKEKIKELQQVYYPNKIIAGSLSPSNEPLFKGRFKEKETYIFICQDNACKYPVKKVEEAFELMK